MNIVNKLTKFPQTLLEIHFARSLRRNVVFVHYVHSQKPISAHGDVSDFPDLLRRLQQSEAAKAIEDSSQKTVER
jgi:hypothetical protein